MELLLLRSYYPKGVNGVLLFQETELCKTIELPWRDNLQQVSCIPEGKYKLTKRYSSRFKWHFEVKDVRSRKYILFHCANDAEKELQGCIAPVLRHTGEGKGIHSRMALDRMKNILYPYLDKEFVITLTIKNSAL